MTTTNHSKVKRAVQFSVLSAKEITEPLKAKWSHMQAANPALYSPYFNLDYTLEVAKLRGDVRIIVAYQCGEVAAFLPVQGKQFARPVGAPMTDYHGMICHPDSNVDIKDMLGTADIGAYHFSGLIHSNAVPHTRSEKIAATDISIGAEAWRAARGKSYRNMIKGNNRRMRKAEAEIGPVRTEFDVRDEEAFLTALRWKKEKFAATGKYNVLGTEWTETLLRNLYARRAPDLRCELHVLYIGDTMAAADLGLTDGKTFHSWIVGYDEQFHAYSPGSQLLEQLIDSSKTLGYDRLDLGSGIEGYKKHYAGIDISAQSGMIAASGPAATLSKVYDAAERFGESVPLGGLGKLPGKFRRRYSQIAACDPTASGRALAMLSAIKNAGKS